MPKEQQRFDSALRTVLKVTPEELRRRLAASKDAKELAKGQAKPVR